VVEWKKRKKKRTAKTWSNEVEKKNHWKGKNGMVGTVWGRPSWGGKKKGVGKGKKGKKKKTARKDLKEGEKEGEGEGEKKE